MPAVQIARLTVCEWSNGQRQDASISDPSWAQIESAIRALNARNLNDLYVYLANDDTWLGVGGGAGRYVVSGCSGGSEFPVLVSLESTSSFMEQVMVGGQLSEFRRDHVVTLNEALSACREFLDVGGFGPRANWAST